MKEDGQDAQADANDGVFMVASDRRSFSVQEMLHAVLNTWSVSKTAKAVHSGMHPDDQQTILEWMLDHQDVTITKFAQVSTQLRCHACDAATLSTSYEISCSPWSCLAYGQFLQHALDCHLQQFQTSLTSC